MSAEEAYAEAGRRMEDLVELYEAGHSTVQIANAIGSTPPTVASKLRKLGVELRKPGVKPEFDPEPILRPVRPAPPEHCTCKRPTWIGPYYGRWYDRKCGKPESASGGEAA